MGLDKNVLTQKVALLQKRAVCVVAKHDFLVHTDTIFNKLNILKCADQYLLNLASLMCGYDHDEIPKPLNSWFKKPNHSYFTRFAKQGKLKPSDYNTTQFGTHSFHYEGTQLLNELKDEQVYTNSKSRKDFTTKLKN